MSLKCPKCNSDRHITALAQCRTRWEDGDWVVDSALDVSAFETITCQSCGYQAGHEDFEDASHT